MRLTAEPQFPFFGGPQSITQPSPCPCPANLRASQLRVSKTIALKANFYAVEKTPFSASFLAQSQERAVTQDPNSKAVSGDGVTMRHSLVSWPAVTMAE
jgi:hypothetical protein